MKKIVLLFFGFFYLLANEIKDIDLVQLDKECDKGKIKSCLFIGSILHLNYFYNNKNKEEKDIFLSENYFEKACNIEGDNFGGCFNVAMFYHEKIFTDNNKSMKKYYIHMAKKYYKKHCEKSKENDCEMLNVIKTIEEKEFR